MSEVRNKHNHYHKPVAGLEFVDVYRVLQLFNVTDPCIQHAVKKLLVAGGRGAGKDVSKDIQESIDSLVRWQEMRAEDAQLPAVTKFFDQQAHTTLTETRIPAPDPIGRGVRVACACTTTCHSNDIDASYAYCRGLEAPVPKPEDKPECGCVKVCSGAVIFDSKTACKGLPAAEAS